jgi:hypothetical protein
MNRELTDKEIFAKMKEIEKLSFIDEATHYPDKYCWIIIEFPYTKEQGDWCEIQVYPPGPECDFQWTICEINDLVRVDYLMKIFEILNKEVA